MKRFAILPAILSLLASAAAGEENTDFQFIQGRLSEIKGQIRKIGAKIAAEVDASFKEDVKSGAIDLGRIRKALTGHVDQGSIRTVMNELKTGAPGGRELSVEDQAKLNKYRRPLDVLDTQIAGKQKEYDRLMNLGWEIDVWGLIEPKGTYGERLRPMYRELNKLRAKRKKLKAEIDAKIKAYDDVVWDTLDKWQAAIGRDREGYIKKVMPGQRAISRLLAELSSLIVERDRLLQMQEYGDMFVVWYNDVGWLYAGTRARYVLDKKRTRGSEIWGGRSKEPLNSSQILEKKGYTTMKAAVEAVGEAIGKAQRKRAPLAFPKVYYVGKVGGKELKLNSLLVRHPSFQKYLPKANE